MKASDAAGCWRWWVWRCCAALPLADDMDWAYPVTPKAEPLDSVVLKQVPGSPRNTPRRRSTTRSIRRLVSDEHPPMPQIVAHGGPKPAGCACAQCHLPNGDGHPESSSLAGLTASYIVRQMGVFKNGERKGVRAGVMIAMAKVLSDAEVKGRGDYFAGSSPRPATTR